MRGETPNPRPAAPSPKALPQKPLPSPNPPNPTASKPRDRPPKPSLPFSPPRVGGAGGGAKPTPTRLPEPSGNRGRSRERTAGPLPPHSRPTSATPFGTTDDIIARLVRQSRQALSVTRPPPRYSESGGQAAHARLRANPTLERVRPPPQQPRPELNQTDGVEITMEAKRRPARS